MILTLCALVLFFAEPDNNVEWNGVSHVAFQDRRPLCPMNGEAFDVYFRAYQFDLTAARVRLDDGGTTVWVNAAWDRDEGPYAIWRASLPATVSQSIYYTIELTDGLDTDYLSPAGMSDDPPAGPGWELDRATLIHAPVGATPVNPGGVVFKVWAPNAIQANVRGEFNNWGLGTPMTRSGEYFTAYAPNAHPRQRYKFFFQPGSLWKPDARARGLDGSGSYDSYVENPFGYAWTSNSYRPPAIEDLIIYELHVGTFSGRNDPVASGAIPGTYRDVAAHVDHLVELGVTAVELMPVTEYPWDFSGGYNPVTQWSPEWKLGTPDDFKFMVDTLHAHGVAVLHDIVWNHFSPSDNYLWHYDSPTVQSFFATPNIDSPWGPQADFSRGPVRQYFLDSALHWLEEYRIDGFRMDATAWMDAYQGGAGWSLMQWLNDTIDNRWVHKICIAEELPTDPWITRPTNLGGAGFDAQWHMAFRDAARNAVFAAAFGDPDMGALAAAINGQPPHLAAPKVMNYVELHDEIMASTGGSRMIKVIDPTYPHDDVWAKGRYKLAQGLNLLAPGIPAFYMGSEWLDDTDFTGGDPGGGGRINWALKQQNRPIFDFFRDAIAVRRSNGCFRANAGWQVFHVNDSANVIAFQRWDASGNVCVVVASFNNGNFPSYRIGLPQPAPWSEILNSQAAVYDGNNVGNGGVVNVDPIPYDGYAQSAAITIPQMGLLVLRWGAPPVECPADLNADGLIALGDLSLLLSNYGTPSGASREQGDVDADGDVDLTDLAQLLGVFGTACP